jgi:hypothetical protein
MQTTTILADKRTILAAALLLTALAVALTLTRSPAVLARSNGVVAYSFVTTIERNARLCQGGEMVPRGASAIRLSLYATLGPSLHVQAIAGGHTIAAGSVASGWSGTVVTAPLHPAPRVDTPATICVTLGASHNLGHEPIDEVIHPLGSPASAATSATLNGGSTGGRMRTEYLRPGALSWWSLLLPVARHMGLAGTLAGTWVVLLAAALMLGAVAIGSRAILRHLP